MICSLFFRRKAPNKRRSQDNGADEGRLPKGRNAEQDESVADHANQQDAQKRAEDRPFAAAQPRAADDDGGDDVELQPMPVTG